MLSIAHPPTRIYIPISIVYSEFNVFMLFAKWKSKNKCLSYNALWAVSCELSSVFGSGGRDVDRMRSANRLCFWALHFYERHFWVNFVINENREKKWEKLHRRRQALSFLGRKTICYQQLKRWRTERRKEWDGGNRGEREASSSAWLKANVVGFPFL